MGPRFSQEDLEQALMARGCGSRGFNNPDGTSEWQRPDGIVVYLQCEQPPGGYSIRQYEDILQRMGVLDIKRN